MCRRDLTGHLVFNLISHVIRLHNHINNNLTACHNTFDELEPNGVPGTLPQPRLLQRPTIVFDLILHVYHM